MAKRKYPPISIFIDLLTDFGFKRIFGSEPNKDLLIDFLNSVLQGRKIIKDIYYNKNEHPGDTKTEGGAIFDLTCTGQDGERFIIEVQRGKRANFTQRSVFYTSRMISEQAPKGRREEWGYELPEVYFIALLEDFSIADNKHFIQDICLANRTTGEVFYDGLNYIFLELVNFAKQETELVTNIDKWLYVLKNMSQMDKIPVFLHKTIFEKLFDLAEYAKLEQNDKAMYNAALKRKWDNKAVLDYARNEGIAVGIAEGITKGIVKGQAEGKAEGIAEGIAVGLVKGKAEGMTMGITIGKIEEQIKIARELKQLGMASTEIARIVDLSVREVEKL